MQISQHIAKHIREIHFGRNWTASSMQHHLQDVTWQEAITEVKDCNTIATLVFHTNYYITHVMSALKGGPFNSKDEWSFAHPPIANEEGWQALLDRVWSEAEEFATIVESLDDALMDQPFLEEKYGTYYRNLHGIIEHMHYHLGQIVFLKKWIRSDHG